MKKFVSLIMAVMMAAMMCCTFTGCEGTEEQIEEKIEFNDSYIAASEFSYSYDKGHSYGNGTKEYEVGETVYMKVKTKIASTKEEQELVRVKLSIPYITSVDAKYYDGQIITPVYDPVQNTTIYTFNVPTNAPEDVGTFVFQFIPNAEAEVRMILEFDDKISSIYDKQNTVKFVVSETDVDGENTVDGE